MTKFNWFVAHTKAGYMDFGVGAGIGGVLALLFGVEALWWYLPLWSALGLLPDADILLSIMRLRLTGNHHESYLHWPLFMLPLTTVAAYFIAGEYWAATTFACVLAHYLHDAAMMGRRAGTVWLLRLKRTPIYDPSHEDHETWIKKHWVQLSPLSLREYLIGSVGLVVALAVIALR